MPLGPKAVTIFKILSNPYLTCVFFAAFLLFDSR